MRQSSTTSLFETLQREFCPPIDSSLLAALLGDLGSDVDDDTSTSDLDTCSEKLTRLRETLTEIAAHADQSQLQEPSNGLAPSSGGSNTIAADADILFCDAASTSWRSSRSSSPSRRHLFSSPLGFLQMVLPHISTARLETALAEAGTDEAGEIVDMWEVISWLLSQETIRELEERGMDGLDEVSSEDRDVSWNLAESKKKKRDRQAAKKDRSGTATKITIVDIRQRQHARPSPLTGVEVTPLSAPDPWTQLSSISSYVSGLLPPHPASFFLSYFHSPNYSSPYEALRSAIQSICASRTSSAPIEGHNDILCTLLDIVRADYDHLDWEPRSRLIADSELAVRATGGRGGDSLDLVKILRDLDVDSASGILEMGVYHARPPEPSKHVEPDKVVKLLVSPIAAPTPSKAKLKPPSDTKKHQVSTRWQKVHPRKTKRVYQLAKSLIGVHLLTHSSQVEGVKVPGSTLTSSNGGSGDLAQARRLGENMRKRDELLKEATRMWQRGNAKNRGGEVALYFAERAREFQELARREALDASREIVQSRRLASGNLDVLDLHGTTVSEAIVIVEETLQERSASSRKPLKIVTGRGTHSTNQVSVLKPAIKKALVREGWIVSNWDGGLILRGGRSG